MAAYLRGLYQFNRYQIQGAEDPAREAVRLDPQMARAHELLGLALLVKADFGFATYAAIAPEARASLQRALSSNPIAALRWAGSGGPTGLWNTIGLKPGKSCGKGSNWIPVPATITSGCWRRRGSPDRGPSRRTRSGEPLGFDRRCTHVPRRAEV